MNAYIYQADIYCAECGTAIRAHLDKWGDAPANPADEHTYDSDYYPKGPYPEAGGESDTPQHCGRCGLFLENPLTQAGYAYVKETLDAAGSNLSIVGKIWARFYDFTYKGKGWTSPEHAD